MPFDTSTRNRLAGFVKDARDLITAEFTLQFSELYGIAADGTLTPVAQLTHLDENGRATAALLRERIAYLVRTHPEERGGSAVAVTRLAREQAFTVLNRLAAVRMAEKRGLILPSVGKGYQSDGFRIYDTVAGKGLGDAYHRYRRYLFCLFDELAIELGVLFNRHAPQGLLFPRETALLALLDLLNAHDLEGLWSEDETIGWIYQYYNGNEVKEMRDAAKGGPPRNSRELAVRNQFFTPRYVVEFLTDNTLGRIWYEMSGGATSLNEKCRHLVRRPNEIFLKPGESPTAQNPEPRTQSPEPSAQLSQEELLRQPVFVPHRPLKDPRTILMLDPACGSMHFGLYAFDLYEIIYAEFWDLQKTENSKLKTENSHVDSWLNQYASKEAYLRDVPRLIIENNLHGIDIDPRCAQIAGLSLWLRAQRAWKDMGLKPAERPVIKRSNIVCAEPMPGEKTQLKEFCDSLKQPVIGQMVEVIFDKMSLAGEAGSLLKIEEEIRDLVHNTKLKWTETYRFDQAKEELFSKAEIAAASKEKKSDGAELNIDFSGITDETFWEKAEERIYTALREYAEQAETGGGFQRRLFAEDAARGFAFIDICRKRYDVALMNPPFGEPSISTIEYVRMEYPIASDNLLIAFIQRFHALLSSHGKLGAITDRSWINKRFYEMFRQNFVLGKLSLEMWVDLGWNVLDANVEVAGHIHSQNNTSALFLNISKSLNKPLDFENNIKHLSSFYIHSLASFTRFPGLAIVYDLDIALLNTFVVGSELCKTEFISYGGLKAGDSESLFRLVWEIPAEGLNSKDWAFFQNGSPYSPYYYGCYSVVRCDQNKWSNVLSYASSRITNIERYFEPGIFYGKRTDWMYGFIGRRGQVPSMEGHLVQPRNWNRIWLDLLIINSSVYQEIANKLCGQHKYAGYINPIRLEVSRMSDWSDRIAKVTNQLESLDNGNEIARNFVGPLSIMIYVGEGGNTLRVSLNSAVERRASFVKQANDLRRDYNRHTEAEFGWHNKEASAPVEVDYVNLMFEDSDSVHLEVRCLLSYFIGVAFGRWDIQYATGEKSAQELPDPFAPLPVCPPGQLQNAQGMPARPEDVPADYPVKNIPWHGILVDDEHHPSDIEPRVHEVLKIIWKDRWESIEREACEILGVKSLRDYFRKTAGFFADHLSRYSKSRRQAPIYWPLSTKSGSYTLWIYYHRLNDQTLHTAVADFVDPKIRATTKALEAARANNRGDEAGDLADLLDELNEFRAELERIIKLPWKPNLNDGVLITASPLWKLFRYNKWQSALKSCWDELEAGDYDWAHLALTLRPDEVREKCKSDRSLAIAHGLEELCEVKAPEKKAKKGKKKKEAELELEEESS